MHMQRCVCICIFQTYTSKYITMYIHIISSLKKKKEIQGLPQQLRLCASTAGDKGSIPGQGTKIPHAVWHSQKMKKKKKVFKEGIIKVITDNNTHMHAKSLQSCPTLCDPMDCSPARLACPQDSPGNTAVGCHALFQGIFLTQGSKLSLLHCRQILYH